MIRVGFIGTGGMANWHAGAVRELKGVKLVACCDVRPEIVEQFAKKWDVPAAYTDYREMLEKEELDAVANITPDAAHCEVALAALARGLHILSEKPLASSLAEAKKMAAAAEKAGVINMVNFSYRNASALHRAAAVVAAGKIGRVMHVESSYLQSWLARADWKRWAQNHGMLWRLSTAHGSAGVLGDLGCHIYDLTTLLCGQDITQIHCRLQTFDKPVPGNRLGEYVLDANDSFMSTVTFANGAIGTVHSSRWASGHGNSLRCRVYGDGGAVEVDLDTGYNVYRICSGRKNLASNTWKTVECKPTPNMWQRFVRSIRTGVNDASDFANGLKIQAYLHYSLQSDKKGRVVNVEL